MGAAPSLTLLRPPRISTGTKSATPRLHTAGTPGSVRRFSTLAALLKATPATALLAAQRQRLVVVQSTDSLTGAFARLIDADVLSAPVYDAARGLYIGWLDLRDLSGLILVRYTYAREQREQRVRKAAAIASGTTTGAAKAVGFNDAAAPADADADAEGPIAPPPTPISCAEFIADAVKGTTEAAADAKTNVTSGAAAMPSLTPPAAAVAKGVAISIASLSARYPWRPLPSTSSLFDVCKELVQDVRRVPIVDVTTEQVVGVVTQSTVIQYLASRMAVPLPGPGHHSVHVPLHANDKANALSHQPTPTLAAVNAAKPNDTAAAAADTKTQAAAATQGAAHNTGATPALGAAAVVKLAAAAAVAGEAAAAAAAPASLDGLALKDVANSEWHKPLSELLLASTNSAESAAPTLALGSAPVWSIADTTPLADALWSMHEANTSTLAITDARTGGLTATLTTADLKLYLRNKRWGDALLDRDVRTFLSAVRSGQQLHAHAAAGAARVDAIKGDGAAAEAGKKPDHTLDTAAPAVVVSANTSLAGVVQKMSACHARKVFVCGTHPPYVPLRVITLTDVLVYVVAADATANTAALTAAAAAAVKAVADTSAKPTEAEAGVALGTAIAAGPICPLPA